MATTSEPNGNSPAPSARPDDTQSLKHHNQLLLANLNATRKALTEARQNEQRSLQLFEQAQALLAEREQTTTATLATLQAQLNDAAAREQQLLALLQERAGKEQPLAARPDTSEGTAAGAGASDARVLAKIDELQQLLRENLAPPVAHADVQADALEAARQREQALAAQVDLLQQALADKDRLLEASAAVAQQLNALLANGEQLLAAFPPLQQHLGDSRQAAETAIAGLQNNMQAALQQVLAKMDALWQKTVAQAQQLEQISALAAAPKAGVRPAAPSRFAVPEEEQFVLDLPSDLLAATGTIVTPGTKQPVPPAGPAAAV